MQLFPVAALLSLAAAVSANFVHIIEVGNLNGQTIYSPNDVVSFLVLSINQEPPLIASPTAS